MSIIQGTAHSGGQYQIERSLRFNSADSAYLNRTPSSAGSGQKFTVSWWQKLGVVGTSEQTLFSAGTGVTDTTAFVIYATGGGSGALANAISAGGATYTVQTASVYRDPSAWYHIVVSVDTTQATALNRVKIYVNAVEVTYSSPSYPTQNLVTPVCQNVVQNIGRRSNPGDRYLSSYVTEFNLIDGQALTPSSFGLNDPETGVWSPKRYTGTYGTNGFYLNFSDNSGTTSTTLGKDYSGNGNNWTPNNFSVTAGAGNDSLVDTPTPYGTDTGAGGEVRGNYATLNPLDIRFGASSANTLANGNLQATAPAAQGVSQSSILFTSGKWYFEMTVGSVSTTPASQYIAYRDAGGSAAYYAANGSVGGVSGSSGASYTTNDVIGLAVDKDAGTIEFFKNGTTQGGSRTITSNAAGDSYLQVSNYNGSVIHANFGQRPFAYTAPSGFKALCTQNLPTPTIGATSTTQAGKYFDVVLRNGFGASGGSVTSLNFQPDFVWEKSRNSANSHYLVDAVRGLTKYILSDSTNAESTISNYFTAFNSNGYTLGSADYGTTTTIADWCWNAGGSNATNTSGTITSTVRANTTSGFSIVTYTGTGGSGTTTVGHGLSVAPAMVITKRRSTTGDWSVYHPNLTSTSYYLGLNTTAAQQTYGSTFISPGSTTLTIAADSSLLNVSGSTYVAYCFAPVAGFSRFGSYTGNGSTDGPFVFTNHRPAFLLIKRTDTTSNWTILDLAREGYNVDNDPLYPNLPNAEGTTDLADILSNGFKLRSTDASVNANTGTYIYMSLASNPFKYSLAR